MVAKAKGGINGASETVENIVTAGSEAMKGSFDRAVKGYDNLATFNKATVEAVIQSANAASKGIEALNAEVLAYSRHSIEEGVAAAKAAMSSKSIQDLIEVQSDYAKAAFDGYVGQLTKFGDLFASLAKHTAEPINGRVSALVELVQGARLS